MTKRSHPSDGVKKYPEEFPISNRIRFTITLFKLFHLNHFILIRDIDRDTETQTKTERGTHAERHTERHKERHTKRQTDEYTERHTEIHT